MKKQILFLFSFVLLSLPIKLVAQEPSTNDQYTVEEIGNTLCNCVNSLMDQLHPRIKKMVRDIDEYGQEEAANKFSTYLQENPEQVDQINKDGQVLQNFDTSIAKIDGCGNLDQLISDKSMAENSVSREDLEAYLGKKSICEYANIFYKLGKQQ